MMPRIFLLLIGLIPWAGLIWLGFTMMNLNQVGPLIAGFLLVVFACITLIIWGMFTFFNKD